MTRTLSPAAWMPLFVLITLAGVSQSFAEIQWQTQLRTAHAQAQTEGKLLLLHFYDDNCVWCERLEAGAFKSPEVATAVHQQFVPVKIHAGKNPSIAATFKVTKFPTDVIVTTQGQALSHSVSPQDPARYVAMLAQATQQPNDEMLAQQQPPAAAASAVPAQSASYALPTSNGVAATPVSSVTRTTAPSASTENPSSEMELAMDGFCAVTVIEEDRWVEGKSEFGVVHLGRLYLFSSKTAMDKFLKSPEPYTPVLNGIDVVRFFEERKIVQGSREWGLKDPDHNRMFFFADEAALNHFYNQHTRYTDAALTVMAKAVNDANPR